MCIHFATCSYNCFYKPLKFMFNCASKRDYYVLGGVIQFSTHYFALVHDMFGGFFIWSTLRFFIYSHIFVFLIFLAFNKYYIDNWPSFSCFFFPRVLCQDLCYSFLYPNLHLELYVAVIISCFLPIYLNCFVVFCFRSPEYICMFLYFSALSNCHWIFQYCGG